MPNLAYQRYREDSIRTASSEQLLVRLSEGMIVKIKQAKGNFQEGKIGKGYEAAVRAMKIAQAISNDLNLQGGGKLIQQVEALYVFVINELASLSQIQDKEKCLESCLKVLEPLHESWLHLERVNHG